MVGKYTLEQFEADRQAREEREAKEAAGESRYLSVAIFYVLYATWLLRLNRMRGSETS